MIHRVFVYPILRRFRTNRLDLSIVVVIDDGWNLGGSRNRLLCRKSSYRRRVTKGIRRQSQVKAEISYLVTPLIPGI